MQRDERLRSSALLSDYILRDYAQSADLLVLLLMRLGVLTYKEHYVTFSQTKYARRVLGVEE